MFVFSDPLPTSQDPGLVGNTFPLAAQDTNPFTVQRNKRKANKQAHKQKHSHRQTDSRGYPPAKAWYVTLSLGQPQTESFLLWGRGLPTSQALVGNTFSLAAPDRKPFTVQRNTRKTNKQAHKQPQSKQTNQTD